MRKRLFRLPWRTSADIERDLDEELSFHLEQRANALRRGGLSAEEAWREAQRQFGDMADARAYCHALAVAQEKSGRRCFLVEAFVQDLTYAVRQIRRSFGFALGTVAILAIAFAASIVCFVYVRAYLLRPLPVPSPERLVWVIPGPQRDSDIPPPEGLGELDWSTADALFETTVSWDLDGFTLIGGERSDYVDGAWVSPGFTRALTVKAARGRLFQPSDFAEGGQVALISHALWQRHFAGDPEIVGRTLNAFSTDRPSAPVAATIVGVLPADLWHFNRFTDVLLPLRGPRMPTLAVLHEGETAAQAGARLTRWVAGQVSSVPSGWRMTLVSAHDEYVLEIRPALRVAFVTCLLLLLVVCVNVAGLLLTRTVVRRRELAVRAAIGAGRSRIVRQVVTECLVFAIAAGVAGLAIARLALAFGQDTVQTFLRMPVPGGTVAARIDGATLLFCAGLVLSAAVLFGVGPALLAAKFKLGDGLLFSRGATSGRKGSLARGVFVTAQLATCLALLAGSITLARTALELRTAELGFTAAGVLKAHLLLPQMRYAEPATRVRVAEHILESMRANPEVEHAALAFPHPFRPWVTRPVRSPSQRDPAPVPAMTHVIAGDYFAALRIPLIDGRVFTASDRAESEPVAVVSASLARKLWPDESPLGKQVQDAESEGAPLRRIVGVVPDMITSLLEETAPQLYVPFAQNPRGYMSLLARGTNDPLRLAAPIQQAIWQVDRDLPLSDVEPLSDVVAAHTARHRFLCTLTTVIAAFALLLALVGLYATVSYDVEQRARELAIRAAVGAPTRELYRLVLVRGMRLTMLGVIAGAALSATVTRLVATQMPAVRALGAGPQVVLLVGLVTLIVVALLAPARQAAAVDPAVLLRE